jgi:hypothetical protein
MTVNICKNAFLVVVTRSEFAGESHELSNMMEFKTHSLKGI